MKNEWISEKEAAELVGYKPETLRRYVREGKLNITFTRLNFKTYQYCKNSIERFKIERSSSMAA